jgi:transcriptional activator of eps genes
MNDALDNYLASYTGIDGGNPHAAIWICGIEHGGDIDALDGPLIPEPEPGGWTEKFRRTHPDFQKWQYHQKVAKLLISLRVLESDPSATPALSKDVYRAYMADELYVQGGQSFKLNLFPFSSPSVCSPKWEEAYRAHDALRDKHAYYNRCEEIRFPFLKAIREQYDPKLVLCTGVTFRAQFAKAFGFSSETKSFAISNGSGSSRQCHRYEDGRASLIVTPFFGGPYGINSNALIIDLARAIAGNFRTVATA